MNDYELAIQHNEAANLACEHIGIDRTKTDGFFDGTFGTGSKQKMVKIVPIDHPLGVMDLEEVRRELEARRGEETRGILLVCVGKELQADHWLEEWNKQRGIVKLDESSRPIEFANKVRVIELRTDQQYGKFFVHQPARAEVKVDRAEGKIRVKIEDFISPTTVERLRMDAGNTSLFKAKITDWRAMVDSVMIDPDYDGEALDVALYDVPESKQDFVKGTYELPARPRLGDRRGRHGGPRFARRQSRPAGHGPLAGQARAERPQERRGRQAHGAQPEHRYRA